jgi:hypothetical protein
LYTSPNGKLPVRWLAIETLKWAQIIADLNNHIFKDVRVFSKNGCVSYKFFAILFLFVNFRWSFGVLLFEVFSLGQAPYVNMENVEIMPYLQEGKRMQKPQNCPDEMQVKHILENITPSFSYELMISCWDENPKIRPTFTKICANLMKLLKRSSQDYNYLSIQSAENTAKFEFDWFGSDEEEVTI